MFYKFELEKTGFALDRANIRDKDQLAIIKFIQIQTDKGLKLPIDTKLALENKIHLSGVLKIFYNISNNQEIIPQHLFDVLTKKFDPKSNETMIDDLNITHIYTACIVFLTQEPLNKGSCGP